MGIPIFTAGVGIVGAITIASGCFSWTDSTTGVFAVLSTLAFELSTIE
ncbi:hypothetical protein [Flavobacterium xinjiangense]|nr:hypothetical protein [Flavobacterium xinjiangense]